MRSNYGFTFYEIRAVLSILTIISSIAILKVNKIIRIARIGLDIEDVNCLNRATKYYELDNNIKNKNIFHQRDVTDLQRAVLIVYNGFRIEKID